MKSLIGYTVQAQDGETGKLHDFFFNEKSWTIEYVVVDLGNWMLDTGAWIPGEKTLVLAEDFNQILPERGIIGVALTKTQVEYSPRLEAEQTSLNINPQTLQPIQPTVPPLDHLGGGLFEPENIGLHPDAMFETLKSQDLKQALDSPPASDAEAVQLHSLQNLIDLYIQANDGSIGHIEDFIVNNKSWEIEHMIVGTRNWFPGRKVVVPAQSINKIDLEESIVIVSLSQEEIENSPTVSFTNGEFSE